MKPLKLFPMFLKLSGRACLVVGGGSIAESKIGSLLETDAKVRVVAPEATAQIRSWAQGKKIEWQPRPFRPHELEGMFLVVAATSAPELHEQIFEEASTRRVRCNVWEVPRVCEFYTPAL